MLVYQAGYPRTDISTMGHPIATSTLLGQSLGVKLGSKKAGLGKPGKIACPTSLKIYIVNIEDRYIYTIYI
jgi:hypothetical protein